MTGLGTHLFKMERTVPAVSGGTGLEALMDMGAADISRLNCESFSVLPLHLSNQFLISSTVYGCLGEIYIYVCV